MSIANPYMVPGARVRVVDHDNCPWFIVNGSEHKIARMSSDGGFVEVFGYPYLSAKRFKPIVRVKAGRLWLGRGVPDNAKSGDRVMNTVGDRVANVCLVNGVLTLSPWWAA